MKSDSSKNGFEAAKEFYDSRRDLYGLPPFEEIAVLFDVSNLSRPAKFIFYEIAQCMAQTVNTMLALLESLISGMRLGSSYEYKMLTVDEREALKRMWFKLQSKMWMLHRISTTLDEEELCRGIREIYGFWVNEFIPFRNVVFKKLEERWDGQKIKKSGQESLEIYE